MLKQKAQKCNMHTKTITVQGPRGTAGFGYGIFVPMRRMWLEYKRYQIVKWDG